MTSETVMYDIGDCIEYATYSGTIRQVIVTDKCDDIKNGLAGFDGTLVSGHTLIGSNSVWGYDYQIIRVISTASC